MRWHKLQIQAGGFFNEKRASNPAYTSSQKGRMLYNETDDQMVLGNGDVGDFVKMFDDAHDISPGLASTYKIGDSGSEFLEIWSDDFFGNLTGDVAGDITGDLNGDVYASNGTDKILDNGTSLAAADAYFAGDLMCIDGVTKLMDNKSTPGAVTFLGTATKAKYA